VSNILLGTAGKHPVKIDLGILLRTRLLVQANSGGGKSFLLRRLAEEMFGHVQVLLIDPEGEFATLREKYEYVLVGKGGETPADCRSAGMVAQRLLELNASAVCDLYELKPSERHRWVSLFLNALIDAPKRLWHPLVVIVDEANLFCPEKGAGESEASDAMISLATRGRKRGYTVVFATQRLGKLRKDAAAELLNVLIGQTFIDIDRKRAAEALGIPRSEERAFNDEMKIIEPGHFYALGRAISKERILVKVGGVTTTHEEPGRFRRSTEPPPPPEKLKKLLPKLADLPKAAEEKARTEADLRTEIRSLKAQLAARPREAPPAKVQQRSVEVEVPIIRDRQLQRLETTARRVNAAADLLRASAEAVSKAIAQAKIPRLQHQGVKSGVTNTFVQRPPARLLTPSSVPPRPIVAPPPSESANSLTVPQQRILRALSEFESIGRPEMTRNWAATVSGASHRSSAYTNNLGFLRTHGLIEYGSNGTLRLTDEGRRHAPPAASPLSTEDMLERCYKVLSGPQSAILRVLHASYPTLMAREEVAQQAGASPRSSAYTNNLGALKSAGMIEYGPDRTLKCSQSLFVS
jgi:hypothetical protein